MPSSSLVTTRDRTHGPRGFWAAFALAAAALLVPLWSVRDIPATDLPQHAAQIRLWQAYDAGDLDTVAHHEIAWGNPYLVGYGLTRILATFLPIPVALKLVLSLCLLALPLACLDLLRRQGADPWWSLAAFPLAFGVSFYWGFLNYLVGLPVAVVYLGRLRSLLDRPGRLFVATVALLPFHVLLFAWCLGAAVLAVALDVDRKRGRAALALVATVPLLLLWLRAIEGAGSVLEHAVHWDWGVHRPLDLLSYLRSAEAADPGAILFVVVAYGGLAVLAGVRRPSRHGAIVGLGLLAGALLLPREAFGLDWIAPRFAVFPAIWGLSTIAAPRRPARLGVGHAWALAVAIVGAAVLLPPFRAFDREMNAFREVTRGVHPGERVLGVVSDATVDGVPGHPLGHAAAWLALDGAEPVFQFSALPQSLVRRTDRPLRPVPDGAWAPDPVETSRLLADERPDAVLLRRPPEAILELFRDAPGRWEISARRGDWWLFRRAEPSGRRSLAEQDSGIDRAPAETEAGGPGA